MNEKNNLKISKELLNCLSAEELIEMKVDLESIENKLDDIIDRCDNILNS